MNRYKCVHCGRSVMTSHHDKPECSRKDCKNARDPNKKVTKGLIKQIKDAWRKNQ